MDRQTARALPLGAAVALLFAPGPACKLQPDAVYGKSCDVDDDCGSGYVCGADDRCVRGVTLPDGGARLGDGGAEDASAPVDGGGSDGGALDGGLLDSGVLDGGAPDGGDAGTGIPIDDLPREYMAAFCSMLTACASLPDGVTPENCVEALGSQPDFEFTTVLIPAVRAGRVAYDPEKAAECLGGLFQTECQAFFSVEPAACEETFQGLVAPGGDCWSDEECTDGAWCQDAEQCPGVCTPYAGVDDACGPAGGRCASGLFCNDSDVCQARGDVDASCTSDYQCRSGLRCEGSACVPLSQPGEACDYTFDCVDGYVRTQCIDNECVLLAEVGAGEDCEYDWQCPDEHACVPHTDDAGTRDTCQPWGQVGDSCANGERCAPGLYCHPTTQLCAAYPRVEQDCAGVCEWGLWCDSVDNKCRAPSEQNESCDRDQDHSCGDGLYCYDDPGTPAPDAICRTKLGDGESCMWNDDCASGVCDGTCLAQCVVPE